MCAKGTVKKWVHLTLATPLSLLGRGVGGEGTHRHEKPDNSIKPLATPLSLLGRGVGGEGTHRHEKPDNSIKP